MSHRRLCASLCTAAFAAIAATANPAHAAMLPTASGTAPLGVDTALGLPKYTWPDAVGDVNGDGRADVQVRPRPYELRVSFGSASRANRDVATAPGWTITHPWRGGSNEYTVGFPAGDFNGDGRGDVFVSLADNAQVVADRPLAAAIALGPSGPSTTALPSATESIEVVNSARPTYRPTEFSRAGDVDHDGFDDAVVLVDSTRLAVVYGGPFTAGQSLDVAQPGPRVSIITAPAGKGLFEDYTRRWPVPLGDVNGDGFDDIGLRHTESSGAVYAYVILGRAARTSVSLSTSARAGRAWRVGPLAPYRSPSDQGGELFPIGNFDGDGLADFAIGTSSTQTAIVHGRTATTDLAASAVTQRLDWKTSQVDTPPYPSDVNGDGYDDLVAGAMRGINDDVATALLGALVVFGKPGNASIQIPALTAGPTTAGIRFSGGARPMGDVDGDGATDLAPDGGIVYGYLAGTVPQPGNDPRPVISVDVNWGYSIGTCGLFRQRWVYKANIDVTVSEAVKLTFTTTQPGQKTRTATVNAPFGLRDHDLSSSLTSGALGTLTLTTVATDEAGQQSDPVVSSIEVLKGGHAGYLWGLACP